MNNAGKTFLALLSGIAAGAAIGILFAPNKGSETRRKIADSSRRVADSIKETAEQGRQAVSNLADKVYHRGEEAATKAYNRGEEAVNKAKTEAEKFKTNVKGSV